MTEAFGVALGIGIVTGLVIIAVMRRIGMHRDRAVGPILLVAIAAFYPVFAMDRGTAGEIAVHVSVFVLFLAIAAVSYRTSLVIAGAALIAHGLFDIAVAGAGEGPEPDWWAPFCLGVDGVIGLWLIFARPWLDDRPKP